MTADSKPKVLILGNLYTESPEFIDFTSRFEILKYDVTTREKAVADMKNIYNDISAIFSSYTGFASVGGLRGELVDAMPDSLEIIASTTVGYDHYDVKALAARGIVVCNAPGHAAVPVANHALYLAISLFRHTQIFERVLQETGETMQCRANLKTGLPWNSETGRPITFAELGEAAAGQKALSKKLPFNFGEQIGDRFVRDPQGHTVGIAGLGNIGKEIGSRLNAIGMKIHYTKSVPVPESELAQLGFSATYHESLDSMLPVCDLLVLALPYTPATHHIINAESLQKLPTGARIINIGRGKLVDQTALVAALKAGKLGGVALDVFENEPEIPKELLGRWDTILSPHIGSSTYDITVAAENTCGQNITNFFYGDRDDVTDVNKQFFKK